MILERIVEVHDVSGVMAIVMDLRGTRIDVRLERVVWIGQRFKFERTSRSLRMDVARERDNRRGSGQEFATGEGRDARHGSLQWIALLL